MSLSKLARKVARTAVPAVTKLSPAGRALSIGSSIVSGVKRVATAGIQSSPNLLSAVQRVVGIRRRKKNFKGISGKEMLELMKLQMLVGKKSMAYQMAVMRALFGKLK